MDTSVEGDEPPSEEVFGALGNETRLQILYSLWQAYDPLADDSTLAFSELYDRVDYETPGNFSYHLDKLVQARFVRNNDGEYAIAFPGRTIVQTIVAGGATADPSVDPVPLDIKCHRCGTMANLSYHSGVMQAHCPRCAETDEPSGEHGVAGAFLCLGLPPTALSGGNPDEILQAACTYQYSRVCAHLNGVCPECANRVTPTIDVCDDHRPTDGSCEACGREQQGGVVVVCDNCKSYATLRISRAIQTHPAVTAFYHDHGIDHQFASWPAERRSREYREEVLSVDPVRIRVTVPYKDENLRLTIDGGLTIVEETREQGTPA